ncbi:hypothetical protein Nepgr_029838 [Nepenthes gracilis]|uniref:Cotton fiber protein n=1 Tax=Nepenthes gracilis TaxID=150966 RepID=A0AAD3TDC5_NEPGR|nr:hypothetical protein Nepgr_029838 [Nepenthes gracilis]
MKFRVSETEAPPPSFCHRERTNSLLFVFPAAKSNLSRTFKVNGQKSVHSPNSQMGKKRSGFAQPAWNLLRLVPLGARKGRLLKCWLVAELRLLPRYLKGFKHSSSRGAIQYGERELSFDETPVIHIRMRKPASAGFKMPQISCIQPEVDFDEDQVGVYGQYGRMTSFLERAMDEEKEGDDSRACYEDEGIDARAEEFIAKFYEQIKLQRQISHLQYNEMINRGQS